MVMLTFRPWRNAIGAALAILFILSLESSYCFVTTSSPDVVVNGIADDKYHELSLVLGEDIVNHSSIQIVHPTVVSSDLKSYLLLLKLKKGDEKVILHLTAEPRETPADFIYRSNRSGHVNVETYTRCNYCYLSGHAVDHPSSYITATLTVFDGLRGIINSRDAFYYIHPVNSQRQSNEDDDSVWNVLSTTELMEQPHYIVTVGDDSGSANGRQIFSKEQNSPTLERSREKRNLLVSKHLMDGYRGYGRFVASSSLAKPSYYNENNHYNNIMSDSNDDPRLLKEYHIETAVFVDEQLYRKYMKEYGTADKGTDKLDMFLLSVISNVDHLLSHHSLGGKLKLVLVHTEIMKTQPKDLDPQGGDIDGYLKNFCKWQSKRMLNQPYGFFGHKLHWDHAILLTGVDLHRKDPRTGRKNTSFVGYAYVNGMCNTEFSCTINEGTSFRGVFVTAHEMGHSMSMTHDGEDSNSCDPNSYLMSASLQPNIGKPKTSWSSCSRKQFDNFLSSSQSFCLKNRAVAPSRLDFHSHGRLPGDSFSPDQQCRVLCGKDCKAHSTQKPNEICEALVCEKNNKVRTAHQALEGTRCGQDKKCIEGRCELWSPRRKLRPRPTTTSSSSPVSSTARPAPQSYWTDWTSRSSCKSSCLRPTNERSWNKGSTVWGVIHETRRCTHPWGFSHCHGEDVRIRLCDYTKICNTYGITVNVKEYSDGICRQESIYRDGNILSTSVTPDSVPAKSCQIWCEHLNGGYVNRLWYLPDGTPCKVKSPANKAFCIRGICQQFGCDGIQFEYSDPSKCRGALQWPNNNHYTSTAGNLHGNYVSTTTENIHQYDSAPYCDGCLRGSIEIVRIVDRCPTWYGHSTDSSTSRCPQQIIYRPKQCPCRQTADEYAAHKCDETRHNYPDLLSGHGKVLTSASGDENLSCYVCCESKDNSKLFFKMENPLLLMPDGTNCTGKRLRQHFCHRGECLEASMHRSKRFADSRSENNFARLERIVSTTDPNLYYTGGRSFANKKHRRIIEWVPTRVSTKLKVLNRNQANIYERPHRRTRHLYTWQTTATACSLITGKRHVTVTCLLTKYNTRVDARYCSHLKKPDYNRTEYCNKKASGNSDLNTSSSVVDKTGVPGIWNVGVWGRCASSNSDCIGLKNRSVACIMEIGVDGVQALVGDRYCVVDKPPDVQICNVNSTSCRRLNSSNKREESASRNVVDSSSSGYIKIKDLIDWLANYSRSS